MTSESIHIYSLELEIKRLTALNNTLVAALVYAKRFLNPNDHDVAFVDAALAAAKEK